MRRGFSLVEALVGLGLAAVIAAALIGELVSSRECAAHSRHRATARALASYLVQEALAGTAASRAPLDAVPAARVPELSAWAVAHAGTDTLERAWAGFTVTRARDGAGRLQLRVEWPSATRGCVELTLEVPR